MLPVGGIREKVLAAHRTGIRHVILPRDNESELAKLPVPVRDEMEVTLVDRLEDAVKVAIPACKGCPDGVGDKMPVVFFGGGNSGMEG